MRIAMLGRGHVGGSLGPAFAGVGHEVRYGVRDPGAARHDELLAKTPNGTAVSIADAVDEAEVVVLAVNWGQVPAVLDGLALPTGAPVLDTTNPLVPGFRIDPAAVPSGAAVIQQLVPNNPIVKVFNTTGWTNMVDPSYPEGPAAMPIAGDDEAAKAVTIELSDAIGFETFDVGGMEAAKDLEHVAMAWIRLAVAQGHGYEIAWRIARRER